MSLESNGPTEASATSPPRDASVAGRAFVTTVVAIATVVAAVALWELKVVVALLLTAVTISAAMRPGVDALARHRVPRAVGVLLHYAVLIGLAALFLSLVVPRLTNEVQTALQAAQSSKVHSDSSVKAKILNDIDQRLHHLPSADKLVHPALAAGEQALEILVGVLFTGAAAAYWLFERDNAIDLVASLVPRPRRKTLRDTWNLIEQKLGAFVRGQLILIVFVWTVVSAGFAVIGEPYWLLLGIGTGVLEVVPVVGSPFLALLIAVGAGLTVSWHIAALAAGMLLAIRLLQDYIVSPRVLGGAVGLSPLVVLISVAVTGILLGSFYVLLSVPIAALVVTIVDVSVRGVDPAEADVPAVLFSGRDAEG